MWGSNLSAAGKNIEKKKNMSIFSISSYSDLNSYWLSCFLPLIFQSNWKFYKMIKCIRWIIFYRDSPIDFNENLVLFFPVQFWSKICTSWIMSILFIGWKPNRFWIGFQGTRSHQSSPLRMKSAFSIFHVFKYHKNRCVSNHITFYT